MDRLSEQEIKLDKISVLAFWLSTIAILLNCATVLYLRFSKAKSEKQFNGALVCSIISLVLMIPTIYCFIRDLFNSKYISEAIGYIIFFLIIILPFLLLLVYLILVCTTDDKPNLNKLWEAITIINDIITFIIYFFIVCILNSFINKNRYR